jgi:hypothetical protein
LTQFFSRYADYRAIGFNVSDALRFAWLVTWSGRPLVPVRVRVRI